MTDYGPHRPEDAPNGVVVLGTHKWPQPHVVAMPAALARQRRELNDRAAGLGPAAPRTPRPLPVQARADNERGRARLIACAVAGLRHQPVPLMWGTP